MFFFFKQKTAYEMRISDWSSDVCSSDLVDKLQGRDELVREESPAPALVGDAGERVQKVEIAGDGAIAGFMTPDGDQHRGLNAITAADGVEPADLAGIARLAAADERRRPMPPASGGGQRGGGASGPSSAGS